MGIRILSGFALAISLCACVVEPQDGGPTAVAVPESGSLVVDWTIDGSKSADECDLSGSATLDVTVTTSNGAPAGEYQQACSAFATTISLAPGRYSAEAVLLDGSGHDRTTPVPIEPFEILGNDQLSIPIAFPAGSFYAQ
jgi:hypothetical protein